MAEEVEKERSVDAVEVLNLRHELGLSQREAGEMLACTTQLIGHIESGRRPLGPYRRERVQELRAAFASGGMEGVGALAPFAKPPRHRIKGGWKASIPPGDAEELMYWRQALGLTQQAATGLLGLSVHSIRAIEAGRMKISDQVRSYMNLEEAKRFKA